MKVCRLARSLALYLEFASSWTSGSGLWKNQTAMAPIAIFLSLLPTCALSGKRPNILFLMTDSMDGRVIDPQATQAQAVELPFLRDFLSSEGTNFVRTYVNSPQCVPSRTSMCTGRRTDQIQTWSNEKGLAASLDGTLDDGCVSFYGKDQCASWAKQQNYSETIFTGLAKLGYGVNLYGKIEANSYLESISATFG